MVRHNISLKVNAPRSLKSAWLHRKILEFEFFSGGACLSQEYITYFSAFNNSLLTSYLLINEISTEITQIF